MSNYLLDVTNSGGPAIHAWGDYGVVGENAGYWGCLGYSDGGVVGLSNSSGYWGYLGRNDLGGFFYGDVQINGTLYKSAGSFKIDHPLDPANKYLSHSFVESPDMKNIYDGVAELDGSGEAWIELPEYFEALNRDFRYQLTCISGFAPVYIAKKIAGNRFKIAGALPDWKSPGRSPASARMPMPTLTAFLWRSSRTPRRRAITYILSFLASRRKNSWNGSAVRS